MKQWLGIRSLLVVTILLLVSLDAQPVEAKRRAAFSGGDQQFPATAVIENCQGRFEFEFAMGNFEVQEHLALDLEVAAPFGAVRNAANLPPKIEMRAKGFVQDQEIFTRDFSVLQHEPVLMEISDGPVDSSDTDNVYNGHLYEIRYSAGSTIPESRTAPVVIEWTPTSLNDASVETISFFILDGNDELLVDEADDFGFETPCPVEPLSTCVNEQIVVSGAELAENDWDFVAAAVHLGGPVDYTQVKDMEFTNGSSLHRSIDAIGLLAEVEEDFRFDTTSFSDYNGRIPTISITPSGSPFLLESISPYGYVKTAEIDNPNTSQVTVTFTDEIIDDTEAFKPTSVIVLDTYASDTLYVNIVEYFNRYAGFVDYANTARHLTSYTESFSIPALAATTNIKVTAVYIDNRDSNKIINVSAAAGGVTTSETSTNPIGSGLNLVEMTLQDVPRGTSYLDFTIESPVGTGDAALLTGIVISYPCLEPTPNADPIANDDTATVNQDSVLTGVSVLANDSDPDGDPLSVDQTPNAAPFNGALLLTVDGTFVYTPTLGFVGNDSFDYVVTDGNGGSDRARVTIAVEKKNSPPLAADDTATTVQDTVLNGASVLANDMDPDGDSLAVNLTPVSGMSHGTLLLYAGGTYDYTPAAGFVGTAYFTYEVMDGNGGSDTAEVAIVVTATPAVRISNVYLPWIGNPIPESPPGEDPQDLIAQAQEIFSGAANSGQVNANTPNVVYKIYAEANTRLTAQLTGSGGDADIYLFPPGTTNIYEDPVADYSANESSEELIQGTVLATGNWYIVVSLYADTVDYQLTVTLEKVVQSAMDERSPTSQPWLPVSAKQAEQSPLRIPKR